MLMWVVFGRQWRSILSFRLWDLLDPLHDVHVSVVSVFCAWFPTFWRLKHVLKFCSFKSQQVDFRSDLLPGKQICSSYKFNHLLNYQATLAVQCTQCRTKGQFKEDNPLKQSAYPICCTEFILLWTVWKGSLKLWIEHTAGQRPLHYHKPDRQRRVSSHTATLLSTEISLLCSQTTLWGR